MKNVCTLVVVFLRASVAVKVRVTMIGQLSRRVFW